MKRTMTNPAWWLGGTLSLSACDLASVPTEPSELVPSFSIPSLQAPRAALSAELAALLPATAAPTRDPFLTAREQAQLDGVADATPVAEEPLQPDATKPPKGPHPPAPPKPGLKPLRGETRQIVLGPQSSFLYEGQQYQEGEVITGTRWVVHSISESGARVRSIDGTATGFIRFAREAQPAFQFAER